MLSLAEVNTYYGQAHILHDMNLRPEAGECVALLGRNGAGKLDQEAITNALAGIDIASPMGSLHMRAQDHQSTMGAWISKTGFIGETPTILDWYYAEPAFPTDGFINTVRLSS